MKIEVDIPVEEFEFDYDEYDYRKGNYSHSFMNIVIDRVAEKIMAEICGSHESDVHTMLSDKLNHLKQTIENRMVKELSDNSYSEIRDKVTERVIADTASRYERSHQYRDIKTQLELESDSAITNGIRSLISDIVRTEVKKIIKL